MELNIIQIFQIQGHHIQILECSPLPLEQVVTRPLPTPQKVQSPLKLFLLLSAPSDQDKAASDPNQQTGSSVGSRSASTSAVTVPDRPTTGKPTKRHATNTRK